MKKFHVWSVCLGIGLLGALLWSIGLRSLWKDLGLLGWGLVPLILLQGVAELFHAVGWRRCLSGPHRALPFYEIFRIRMAGFSIEYLTPTASLGGEVTKGALLSFKNPGPEAATGVIIGKLSYSLAQLFLGVAGSIVILWGVALPPGVWPAMLGATVLLGGGILGFLVVQRKGKLGSVVRWLVSRRVGGRTLRRAAEHITQIDEALALFYEERPLDLVVSVIWHMVGMACGILQSWYFLFLMTDGASILTAAGIWCLGTWLDMVAFAIPSNIGVLEATRVLAFRVLGFAPALGLTYGVALRLEQISWAVVGLLIYASLLFERRRSESASGERVARGRA